MERVQFQQEQVGVHSIFILNYALKPILQMLSELKDLVQKGLFTAVSFRNPSNPSICPGNH